jgi:periplasmic protein TonB
MAYADQDGMSTNRLVSIIIVLLLHAFLGYALVTGLAYDAVIAIKEKMTVVDVKEEKPPEEEPPPEPEKQIEPPVVSPPPLVKTVTPPPQITTVATPPPSITIVPTAAPPAPAAPPPPPPPVAKRPNPVPKGNPGNWANTNDYPSRALQQEREGTTGFRVTVGPNGRVTDCQISSSSGHPDLDQATCTNVTRRARFDPALDGNGNPTTGSYSNRVRWQIPK